MCLRDFIDWKYITSWLVFATQLVNCWPHGQRNYTCVLLPLCLLSDLPPPLPKVNVQNLQTVAGWLGGGGAVGVELCEYIFCRSLALCFLTRFRTLLHYTKQK